MRGKGKQSEEMESSEEEPRKVTDVTWKAE